MPLPASAAAAPGRRERKERTRNAIYHAALELFAERGFAGVTIEHICEAADVAKGTFFLHFPTKSALLFEFNREMAARISARLGVPRGSAVSEFQLAVDMLAMEWLQNAEIMKAMLNEFILTPESVLAAESEVQDLLELFVDIIEHGQRRGEFRRGIEPRLGATVFFSTATAVLTGKVFNEADTTPAEARRQVFELLLDGLRPTGTEAAKSHPEPKEIP